MKNNRRREAAKADRRYAALMEWIALPVLAIAPLVFRLVRLEFVSPTITNTTSADTGFMNDTFTHYKMVLYYILAAALLAVFIVRLLRTAASPTSSASATTAAPASPAPASSPKSSASASARSAPASSPTSSKSPSASARTAPASVAYTSASASATTAAPASSAPASSASSASSVPASATSASGGSGGGFALTRYDAALGVLCACLLLSCILSEYKSVAINGFVYMLDGTVEHICYCVFFFMGFHVFAKSGGRAKRFLIPLYVVGLANALISLIAFLGVDMINTAFIKVILGVPAGAKAMDAKIFTNTFGNVNYLSGFGGVLFTVFFTRLLFSPPSMRRPAARSPADAVYAGSAATPRSPANVQRSPTAAQRSPAKKAAGRLADTAPEPARLDKPAFIDNLMSAVMIAASFSIIVTSLSSSGFLVFVVMVPVVLIFAALSGVTKRKALLAAASLALCALIFIPLAATNAAVYEETFGMFKAFTSVADARIAPPAAGPAAADARVALPATEPAVANACGSLPAAEPAAAHIRGESGGIAVESGSDINPLIASFIYSDNYGYKNCENSENKNINETYNDSFYSPAGIRTLNTSNTNFADPGSGLVTVATAAAVGGITAADPSDDYFAGSAASFVFGPAASLAAATFGDITAAAAFGGSVAAATVPAANSSAPSASGFALPSYFPVRGVSAGTGRLYIWKETLRLIADRPLTGYGMDTLTYAFPQNRLDKISGIGSYTVYVTKPHNIFIGYAYGAGVPALLAFILLSVFTAAAFLRWFAAHRSPSARAPASAPTRAPATAPAVAPARAPAARASAPDPLIMCALLGWAAYLLQGFVNDDLIATVPLWWTLFGIGAGMIRLYNSSVTND